MRQISKIIYSRLLINVLRYGMETQRNYNMSSRGLHYDLKTRQPASEKNNNTVYFASQSEYRCYLALYDIFSKRFTISTQPRYKKGALDWRLDFKIEGTTTNDFKTLANIARYCNDADFSVCPFLLVEYKGFADINFRRKIKELAITDPMTYNLLLVISRKEDIYTFYNNGIKYSKPIYTIEKLRYLVNTLI